MNEQGKYGILWGKWLGGFAAFVWIAATYIGLILALVALSVGYAHGWKRPDVVAAWAGVVFTSAFHWMLFGMVEHGHIKHMNDRQ